MKSIYIHRLVAVYLLVSCAMLAQQTGIPNSPATGSALLDPDSAELYMVFFQFHADFVSSTLDFLAR